MLGIVQNLVEIEPPDSRAEEYDGDDVTYVELMQTFKLRQYQSVLLGWFESAEAALLGSGELRGLDLKAVKNVILLRSVVFAWVCEVSKVRFSCAVVRLHWNSNPRIALLKSKHEEPETVKLKFKLPDDTFDDLMRAVTAACSHIKAQIRQDRQALLKNHTPASSANPTPSKPPGDNSPISRSVSKSPSKSALKRKLSALDGTEQNTPSKRVAFMKSVPEVDEGETSGDETMETPSKQRVRLFADGVADVVMPMAKLQPEVPTTRSWSTSKASTSQRTDQLPDDGENPTRVGTPSVTPITPATAIPTTPRRNRSAPSTPKRTPGSQTRGKSTPRWNDEDDMVELVLPPRHRPAFLDHRQWYARDPRIERGIVMGEELRRMFMEKFGQSIIDKYRPTAIT